MARIIGGIAASHTPTIGFAYDRNKRDDPVWAPIFENFAPLAAWLAEKRPDVLVLIYNDHVSSFFFDHYSAFALGIGPEWQVADEGGGPRNLPPIKGDPKLAAHLGNSLMADEFDMSFFQRRALDHGVFSPLSVLCPHESEWPVKLIPLQMGVLQMPIPSARRFYKLGQALRRAIESYPEDLRVAVVATGGLSHQVHGERCGFNNTEWDHRFLDLFEHDPERLADMTIAEYAELGGFEGSEVVMWLTMRGALPARVECKFRSYYLPSMAGIATAIYEGSEEPDPVAVDSQRRHVARELAGVERLAGTYPFTLEKSVERYRINDYLHRMVEPTHREAFMKDPEASFEAAGLTEEERDLIRRRDWRGMTHYGVIFFMLEKLGAVVGVSNLHIYAGMRGETLEAFQETRNTKALYSVAGQGRVHGLGQEGVIAGISSMAMRQVLVELADAHERRTGARVQVESVGGVEAARRVQEGEAFDFVVLAADAIERLAAAGRVDPASRADLVRSGIAMAVAAGTPPPAVDSEEAFREAVGKARAIGYSTGPSGMHLLRLFERWSIKTPLVQAPPGIAVGSLVAQGEVELGFQQLSELIHLPGIEVVTGLAPQVQLVTVFSGAVCTTSKQPADTAAFLAFIASSDAEAAKRRHGMEPA